MVAGRRYARRANVDRIFVAQAVSSVLLAGWHTKIRRRLGESCGTRPLYGPPISSDEMNSGTLGTSPSRFQIGMRSGPSPSGLTPFGLDDGGDHLVEAGFQRDRTCSASSASLQRILGARTV